MLKKLKVFRFEKVKEKFGSFFAWRNQCGKLLSDRLARNLKGNTIFADEALFYNSAKHPLFGQYRAVAFCLEFSRFSQLFCEAKMLTREATHSLEEKILTIAICQLIKQGNSRWKQI